MTVKNRLHIGKLLSIGAVEAGDNPESDILLWKSAPEVAPRSRTGATAKAAEGVGGPGSPFAPTVVAYVMKRLDAADEALTEITSGYESMRREIGMMSMSRTAKPPEPGTIRAEVDRLALEKIEKGEAPDLTRARPMVWKERPDLVEASHAEPGRVPGVYGGRAPAAGTIPEQIAEVVKERADEMSGIPSMWNETDAERRVRIWKTPQGRKLRDAYTDAMKRGETKFAKSNDHADALEILKRWQADPAEGLQ